MQDSIGSIILAFDLKDVLPFIWKHSYILLYNLQLVCTMLIVFYILFQAEILRKIDRSGTVLINWTTVKEIALIIFLFGFLAIFSTYVGIRTDTANNESPIANVRDLAPMIAGMLGGPVAGTGAGILGSVHRYFYENGQSTALPCSLATLLSGIFGGIIHIYTRKTKKKFIKPLYAAIFSALFETFHMVLVLFLGKLAFTEALYFVKQLIFPMVAANSFGMYIFAFMVHRALNYRNIKEVKDKIEVELNMAHEIQLSMLPRIFPPFPDRKELDIFAIMRPAKNVGGDFYDFFLIDEKRLCFIIGDVSDKGVPAALFMTIIKTLLKTEALRSIPPDAVLKRVNDILYPDNESCSFATIFCGILNLSTGEIEFSNGGHLPPVLISANMNSEFLKMDRNYIVGSLNEAKYTTQKINLKKGEIIFLYTDGITDASNEKREMFSRDRIKTILSGYSSEEKSVSDIVQYIQDEVDAWSGQVPQFDDITMLAIRYIGI